MQTGRGSRADTGWALEIGESRTGGSGSLRERPRTSGLGLIPCSAAWRAHLPYLHPGHDQWITHGVYAPRGNSNPSHHFSCHYSQNKKRILPPDEERILSTNLTNTTTSGKKIIASLASGRTRRSGRFRRNLLNSDANRHGTVRPDAVRHGICLPDGAWQCIFVLATRCQGIFLLDAAVSGHFPSGCSRVRAFSFWM